ncbi:YbfB/YjiJ family MFS transporter [Pseudomonas sp. NW5]|uniref:YbfB/YjiJ family MFS transporter n=1 Tax=Pseudomonas sp. NW5 TaxID=2934934 RepID=UPI00202187F0|nr:YbfB/YjiJ family MFS transporter [Pseudomonas sp. NW5]MCL7461343.1 YbfB/YjiJ family MFS transporter [Pseudomonas sp. NW5]
MDLRQQRLRVLCAGIFSLLLTLGLARFAYTPLLPLMQAQVGLGVAAAGWLAAINYTGYLAGALLASLISDPALKLRLYRLGLLAALLSTWLMGLTTDVGWWALSRFVAGLGSAAGMLLGTGLILNWLIRHDLRGELGIHFSGIGLSIAGCALVVGLCSLWLDWRMQWFVLGALGVLLLIPALRWMPAPATVGSSGGAALADQPPGRLFFTLLLVAYFCAGIGYVVSATFIVAIVEALPGLAGQGTWVFLVVGLAAAPGCIFWDLLARRTGTLNALILAALLHIAGILLPLWGGLGAALAGAALFGLTFVGMVSLVLSMAGRFYPSQPARMMGRMTLAYGVAQIIAPALTGWLALRLGSYDAGLYLAAAAMLLASGLLLILRRLPPAAPAR